MSEELARVDANVDGLVHPLTGELVDLTAETDELSRVMKDLDAQRESLKALRSVLAGEILRRMDRRGEWTLRPGRGSPTLKGVSKAAAFDVKIDGAALRTDLLDMIDRGELELDIEAIDAAVEQNIDWKVKAGGIKRLRAISPQVREVVDRHTVKLPKERYVRVMPNG